MISLFSDGFHWYEWKEDILNESSEIVYNNNFHELKMIQMTIFSIIFLMISKLKKEKILFLCITIYLISAVKPFIEDKMNCNWCQ